MTKYEDLTPAIILLSIALDLTTVLVAAYVLSSQQRTQKVQKRALWTAAVVSTLVALFGTVGYAVPVLGDFRTPEVPFREALIGTAIVWGICLFAWLVAARCAISALRKG